MSETAVEDLVARLPESEARDDLWARLEAQPAAVVAALRAHRGPADRRPWIAAVLAESSHAEAHRLLLEMWTETLDSLRTASPPVPPWQLSSWTGQRDELSFFEEAGELVEDWSPAALEACVGPVMLAGADPTKAAAAHLVAFWKNRSGRPYPARLRHELLRAAENPSTSVREEVAWALSLASDEVVPATFRKVAQDPEGRVRAAAMGPLAGSPDPADRAAVLTALSDAHPWVRVSALHALETTAPRIAAEAAERLARDEDEWVRDRALRAGARLRA